MERIVPTGNVAETSLLPVLGQLFPSLYPHGKDGRHRNVSTNGDIEFNNRPHTEVILINDMSYVLIYLFNQKIKDVILKYLLLKL